MGSPSPPAERPSPADKDPSLEIRYRHKKWREKERDPEGGKGPELPLEPGRAAKVGPAARGGADTPPTRLSRCGAAGRAGEACRRPEGSSSPPRTALL